MVLFNSGWHGFYLSDETDYKTCYSEMIRFLLRQFQEEPGVLLLSTSPDAPARGARGRQPETEVCIGCSQQ